MHYRKPPISEAKLVRCVRGAIHDVIVDLRSDSNSYGKHFAVQLTAENHRALYVPELFAHGFQTLQDDSEVEYQMSDYHDPDSGAGFPHDDRKLAIEWPLAVTVISEQDSAWPSFR